MERHEYVRIGRFKNKNCGYALVNGVVFSSVYEAESYCTREGLDVNTCIQADDPAVLAECKRIACTTLPILREMLAQYDRENDSARAELERKVAARDKAKEKRELGWEVYQDWVLEASGKMGGRYEGMALIRSYVNTLERIRCLKATQQQMTGK